MLNLLCLTGIQKIDVRKDYLVQSNKRVGRLDKLADGRSVWMTAISIDNNEYNNDLRN